MFTKNLINSGWLHALFMAAISYPITSMTLKIVSSHSNTNILVYTTFMMLSCSAAMLIISGSGELSVKTLKRPETWIYALLQILSYVLLLISFKYISATEGAALGKMGGLFVFILSIFFLNQKSNKYENIGAFIVFLGFYFIIYNTPLPIEAKVILTIVVSARALVQCGQKMITEIHKTNKEANNFKSQIRVTGFIMAISSFAFLIFLLTIAYVKKDHDINFFATFPILEDFINFEAFLLGLFLGAIMISTSKYCEFYAGKTIGSKYLTSISSLELIFIFALEYALSKFNIIESRDVSTQTFIALVLVFSGSIIISIAGFFKDLKFIKKGQKRDTLKNMDGNFIDNEEDFKIAKVNLANILTLYDENVEQVAEHLDTTKMMIDNILHYDLYEVKLSRKLAKKISNFASMNVSLRDKLTKAYNRYYLEQKTKNLFKRDEAFKLYYLDLNKFKPVNDTYGHDAGDEVLIKTTERLESIVKEIGFVVRLGGDEFVIIQLENIQHDLSAEISESLERPMTVKSTDKEINISTSIGICESYDCTDFEEMLSKADANMFKDKDSR